MSEAFGRAEGRVEWRRRESNWIGGCGRRASPGHSVQISRLQTIPLNTRDVSPEMWPELTGTFVDPTGRRREQQAVGTCPGVSTPLGLQELGPDFNGDGRTNLLLYDPTTARCSSLE